MIDSLSPEKAGVGGSTPSLATIIPKDLGVFAHFLQPKIRHPQIGNCGTPDETSAFTQVNFCCVNKIRLRWATAISNDEVRLDRWPQSVECVNALKRRSSLGTSRSVGLRSGRPLAASSRSVAAGVQNRAWNPHICQIYDRIAYFAPKNSRLLSNWSQQKSVVSGHDAILCPDAAILMTSCVLRSPK